MDKWITRFGALLCAAGAAALFWSFGMFVAVPWHEGRLLAMNKVELQVVLVPLAAGLLVGWAALHLFALSLEQDNALGKRLRLTIFAFAALLAAGSGMSWSLARFA